MTERVSSLMVWSLTALLLSVNASAASTSQTTVSKVPSSNKAVAPVQKPWEFLVKKLLKDGTDYKMPDWLGGALGIGAVPAKVLPGTEWGETEDGLRRGCDLLMERDEDGKLRPRCLLVTVKQRNPSAIQAHYLRVKLDGTLEAASLATVQMDESGKPIPGSGVMKQLDESDAETAAMLKREFEFWMNRYTKKPAKTAGSGSSAAGKKGASAAAP